MEVTTVEISSYRHGTITELSKKFGVSRKAVYDAFTFRSNTELANSIRNEAINVHGARLEKRKFQV